MAEREGAQMMLLGAVVLVIGFLILSGITARIAQLPQETARGTGRLLEEAKAVEAGVVALDAAVTSGADFAQSLDHLVRLEAQRGFLLRHACLSDDVVSLTLADGASHLSFSVRLRPASPNC